MTTETSTSNRSYPLPYPSNLLAADVLRLRDALNAIDADMAARPDAAAITTQINAAIQALVAGAPEALDTLNELAAALSDDADFAGTVTSQLGTLQSSVTAAQSAATAAQSTADSKASLSLAIALG